MPPVVGAVVTAVAGSVGAAVAGFSFSAIATQIAASVVLSAVSGALSSKPKAPKVSLASRVQGRQELIRQPVQPRRTIYGETVVAGTLVYAESYSVDTPNQNDRISLVIAIAGHEVDSFTGFYFDTDEVTIDGSGAVQEAAYNGFAWIYTHLGTAAQAADSELVSRSSKWTSAHRGRGVAYIHVVLKYDGDVYPNGVPQIRVKVRGKKVLDTRTSTTAWTDNAALITRDYIVSKMGAAASEFDTTVLDASADTCDETVSSESRYTINGSVEDSDRPREVLDDMLAAMAGTMTFIGGTFGLHAGKSASKSLTLTADDIRDDAPIVYTAKRSRSTLFNAVKPVYVDPDRDYQATSAPVVENAAYETADGGTQIVQTLELPFTDSVLRAQRLANIALERHRSEKELILPTTLTAVQVQAWDVIGVELDEFGLDGDADLWRIVGWKLAPGLGVDLVLREEDATDWDDYAESALDTAPTLSLPNLTPPAPGVLSVSEELRETASGGILTVVTLTATASEDAMVNRYEFQFKKTSDSTWMSAAVGVATSAEVAGLVDGTSYDFRVRAVNAIGRRSDWTTKTYAVIGQTARPEDVTNFAVNIVADKAHLSWDAVGDVDLSHYVVRWSKETSGATWTSSVVLDPKVSRPATSVVLPALVGTYLIKAVDRKGNESASASTSVTTIPSISGLNVVETVTEHPSFAGAKSGVVLVADKLQLNAATDIISDWTALSDISVLAFGVGSDGLVSSGTYTFSQAVDLGAVYTSRVTMDLKVASKDFGNLLAYWPALTDVEQLGSLSGGAANVRLEIRTTEDDPSGSPTWSSWRPFQVGDYKGRGLQFRAILSTSVSTVTPIVEEAAVTVDMPDRVDTFTGTSTASTLSLSFSPAFKDAPVVGITGQDLGNGERVNWSNLSATGVDIDVLDSGGSNVSGRSLVVVARGYGSIAT